MKIAINGDIIDTKDIYKIHNITKNRYKGDGGWYHEFIIESFKNKRIYIEICFEQTILNNKIEQTKLIKKLENFRDSIIKIWSENQSDIPQFNL